MSNRMPHGFINYHVNLLVEKGGNSKYKTLKAIILANTGQIHQTDLGSIHISV